MGRVLQYNGSLPTLQWNQHKMSSSQRSFQSAYNRKRTRTRNKEITNNQALLLLLLRAKARQLLMSRQRTTNSKQQLRTVCFLVIRNILFQLVQPGVGCNVMDIVATTEKNPSLLMDISSLMWCSIVMTFARITCQRRNLVRIVDGYK